MVSYCRESMMMLQRNMRKVEKDLTFGKAEIALKMRLKLSTVFYCR